MNNKKTSKYKFKNDVIEFESIFSEFTDKAFEKFNKISKQKKLIEKLNDLIDGKIVNETENQSALHPKYRKYSDDHETKKLVENAEVKAIEFLKKHSDFCIGSGFKEMNVITLGIGGSYEGPKLLLESINNPMTIPNSTLLKLNYDFITGSDDIEFKSKIKFLTPENTIFIVSSKSFTTDETIEILQMAFAWSSDKDRFIAITANPDEVKKYGIKNIITFDKEIGGRYSIWSPISQFHLFGNNRKSFMSGGHQADKDIIENQDYFNFIKRLSFTDVYASNSGKNVRVILSYIWNLLSLPSYLQQLEMESLGKAPNPNSEFKNTGQIVFGGYGPTAQHSYFQLLHQGTHNIVADFISSKEERSNLAYAQSKTQSKLLAYGEGKIYLEKESKINGNVPVNFFLLNEFNSYSLGYLIATWEYRTYVTAAILGINPFDQFGVNAGKIYTKKYLAEKD